MVTAGRKNSLLKVRSLQQYQAQGGGADIESILNQNILLLATSNSAVWEWSYLLI